MIPRRRVTSYQGMIRDIFATILLGRALHGPETNQFEQSVARKLGVRHAIAVSSGRFGMKLILESLDLASGDEVILPAYTLQDLPNIVASTGLKPVLADAAPGLLNCGAAEIAQKINAKTKVIILTHMMGEAADVEGILALAAERNLIVVEDNAHAIGVKAKDGRALGSLGRAGFVSLETSKIINTFGGGIVTTDDDRLAEIIRQKVSCLPFSSTALAKRIFSVWLEYVSLTPIFAPLTVRLLHSSFFRALMIRLYRAFHKSNRKSSYGYNNLQAVLGLRQMERLDHALNHRISLARIYLDSLHNMPGTILDLSYLHRLKNLANDQSAVRYNGYSLILFAADPENLTKRLLEEGIDIGSGPDVCDDLPALFDPEGSYPNTKEAISRVIQIPIFSTMTEKQVRKVCHAFLRLR